MTAHGGRPKLSPSKIGNFFRLQSCPMYLQWEYDDDAESERKARDWETSDPGIVLTGEGDTFEQTQLKLLDTSDTQLYGISTEGTAKLSFEETWRDDAEVGEQKLIAIAEEIANFEKGANTAVIFQPHLSGVIGAYSIGGKGDILLLEPAGKAVRPILLEVKSSSEQKVYHRYQAAIYAILLERMLEDKGIEMDLDDGYVRTKIITPDNNLAEGVSGAKGFDVSPYHAKLELKLQDGGSFDQTILNTSFGSTTNRIARRCAGCEFEPLCVTRAVESQGLELLGLQAGTQKELHRLGLHTVKDIAELYKEDFERSVHWDNDAPTPTDFALAQKVRQEAEVSNLLKRVQIAYRFISEIDSGVGAGRDFSATPLRGTGNNIPTDEHGEAAFDWEEWAGVDYPSGGLVRVYPFVQQDHAQDRVTMLAARVACSYTGYDETIFIPPQKIPTNDGEIVKEENRLFREFFDKLSEKVRKANPDYQSDPNLSDAGVPDDHGFLHLYFYSNDQRDVLVDATDRHRPSPWGRPLRTLLGLREGIDQEVVTVLQDDFRQRWALRFPGLGTLQSTTQFATDEESAFNWRPTIEGDDDEETELPLDTIFEAGLFEGAVKYRSADGGLLYGNVEFDHTSTRAIWTEDDMQLKKWYYPLTNREQDQIPIEYIWGVYGRLTEAAADDPELVRPYLYKDDSSERIEEEDLEALATQFARATEHIERTVQNTNRFATDKFVNKEPIPLEDLENFSFKDKPLQEVCIEYQELEYQTDKEALKNYYRQPLEERVDTGASLVFECTGADDETGMIEGKLHLPTETGYKPLRDRSSIQSFSISDGDFMVITRLDQAANGRQEQTRGGYIDNISNSPTVTISALRDDGTILLNAPFTYGWPRWGKFTIRHRGWSTDAKAQDAEWSAYINEGELFVVDPMIDKITQSRAYEALTNAEETPIHKWVAELYDGNRDHTMINRWEVEHLIEYLDLMDRTDGTYRPKNGQDSFVEDISHGILTLQGPPGTGKTRYTISPAVLGRVHSDIREGKGHLGVVSAVSHNAVNEALESMLALYEECPPGGGEEELDFIRICSSRGQGVDHPQVRNVHYNQDSDEELTELFEKYFSPTRDESTRALVFGPPVSVRSCINKMLRLQDEGDQNIRISDWMNSGQSAMFDLAVIDEASMMDLPLFFLVGAFVAEGGQMMLVGDHRQMQPIQKHDWESEDREPIQQHRPFFSALDFFRFLRGDPNVEIGILNRDPPKLTNPKETLPDHKLNVTYRLPPESAQMHTDLFYEQDKIELTSGGPTSDMPKTSGPMSDILDSDARITLLVHDEGGSQKSNAVEQAITTELLNQDGFTIYRPSEIPEDDPEAITAGVVVPFRAHRRDIVERVPDEVAVDTVERFQGGERDLMILSMAASERGYISQLSEFLLEPNRFNVGASRMKRKLVVIASSAIFEESSNDITAFEDQKAWISFFKAMGGLTRDPDKVPVVDLLRPQTEAEILEPGDDKTLVRIYSGYTPPK